MATKTTNPLKAIRERNRHGFDNLARRLEESFGVQATQCADPDIVDIEAPVEGSILRVWEGEPDESRARYRVKIGLNPPVIVNTLSEVMAAVADRIPE